MEGWRWWSASTSAMLFLVTVRSQTKKKPARQQSPFLKDSHILKGQSQWKILHFLFPLFCMSSSCLVGGQMRGLWHPKRTQVPRGECGLCAPPGDTLPLLAWEAGHKGHHCDPPLSHPAAPAPQCLAGQRRDSAGLWSWRGAPAQSPRLSPSPPASPWCQGISPKLPPFPPLSSSPQDGAETPQVPEGGLGGEKGSPGETLSTGAPRGVRARAAAEQ